MPGPPSINYCTVLYSSSTSVLLVQTGVFHSFNASQVVARVATV